MEEPRRVTPEEIYPRIKAGEALLVCAYDREDKFLRHRLQDAISFSEFKALLPALPRDREIVFYCA